MAVRLLEQAAKAVEGLSLLAKRSTLFLDRRNRNHIYLEVGEDEMQKTMRRFLVLFQSCQYHVFLRAHFSRRTFANARLLRWHDNVSLIWRDPAAVRPSVLCTDRTIPDRNPEKTRYGKVIHVSADYHPMLKVGPCDMVVNEMMHPQIYERYHEHERLPALRRSERKIRIFFAGACNSTGYNNPIMTELFQMQSRYRILRFLEERDFVKIVRDEQELSELLAGPYCNGFVLLDTRRFRIDQADWLSILSQSDFFLCPPGVVFPMSHNAIEAMAVGAIPLINYPNWFSPKLKTGVDCISFATLDDLESAINTIIEMGKVDIEEMRQNVIDYYSRNLDVDLIARRLLEHPADDVYLHMCEENEGSLRRAFTS